MRQPRLAPEHRKLTLVDRWLDVYSSNLALPNTGAPKMVVRRRLHVQKSTIGLHLSFREGRLLRGPSPKYCNLNGTSSPWFWVLGPPRVGEIARCVWLRQPGGSLAASVDKCFAAPAALASRSLSCSATMGYPSLQNPKP